MDGQISDLGGVIFKDNLDARIEAQPVAPAPGGNEPETAAALHALGYPSAFDGVSPAMLTKPASMRNLFEGVDTALQIHVDEKNHNTKVFAELHSKLAELELALSKVQTQLAMVAGENEALKLIVEHARASQRGEAGAQGLRGAPGRDGPRGERGNRGAEGRPGAPAPAIAAWEVRPERFEVVPRYSNGEAGPPLCLLPLFQSYDAAVSELEDRDLTEAAHASREGAAAETEAARWSR